MDEDSSPKPSTEGQPQTSNADSIETADLDKTSLFRAKFLFPGNFYLEYADGDLPLDVEPSSTVMVGWNWGKTQTGSN